MKVWEQREFRNLDDSVELGTRNLKLALRKLRNFAREGAPEQLDLDGTIDATARNAGLLDLKLVPERHNAVKVLLFLDVGGSMDGHVRVCEELFSAARSEFKHLEHFYFHNCLYESLWKDNRRRHARAHRRPSRCCAPTRRDYRAIFVGDATMSPYEITHAGAGIEEWNDEPGAPWLERLARAYPASGLAQSRAGAPLAALRVNPADPRSGERPHVSADHRRSGSRDCRTEATASRRSRHSRLSRLRHRNYMVI